MSVLVTLAAPDDGKEPEQRRNITQKTTENSADSVIVPTEPHKRKRDYLPKTPQECARSRILKSSSTQLRERFIADMQYNSLSKTTKKNYLHLFEKRIHIVHRDQIIVDPDLYYSLYPFMSVAITGSSMKTFMVTWEDKYIDAARIRAGLYVQEWFKIFTKNDFNKKQNNLIFGQ